jgi:Cof subfamily protein (haloacid dehalogenase superfamily)
VAELSGFRAVVLDLDGTLAGADHQVSRFAQETVRRLAATGVRVVISTGRSADNALRLARAMGTGTPVVSANGAVVADPTGRRLKVVELEPSTLEHYLTLADQADLDAMIWTADRLITAGPGLITELMALVGEYPVELAPRAEWPAAGVIKVLMAAAPQVLDNLDLSAYPLVQRSLSHFIEATAPTARKDLTLAWLLKHLGVDPAQTIAFGDAETDLASLTLAGLGVAPANATPSVRAGADLVIGHNGDDAVARFLNNGFDLGVPDSPAL